MKIKKLFVMISLLMVSALFLIGVTSCGNNYTMDDIVFEDASFDYDGEEHSIYCQNLPKGVDIKYINNKKVEPGVYTVDATIKLGEEFKILSAKMTINKLESVVTAEANQETIASSLDAKFAYTINNEQQSISYIIKKDGKTVGISELYKAGVYEVELFAAESKHYKESNHVKVNLTVRDSDYNVSFLSKTVIADGAEKKLEIEGTLPSGYTVEYKNNKGTEQGHYYATADIKDAQGKIVETHNAVLTIDYADDEEFEQYLDEFFVEYLEGDQLAVNIFCENPSDFGLERYDAVWYTFTLGDDDTEEIISAYDELIIELEEFSSSKLSYRQQIAYKNVHDFASYQKEYYSIPNIDYIKNHYIDQFGGYVADFGTYMEAYTLREEADVEDIVNYIESTFEAFKSYLTYLDVKTEKGFGLSSYTIGEMRNYLKDILDSHPADGSSNYYLEDVLKEKIDKVEFLTADKKTQYKSEVETMIDTKFIPGVQALYDGLAEATPIQVRKEGYWASYKNGSTVFEMELENLLGLELDTAEYIKQLEFKLSDASKGSSKALSNLVSKYGISTNAQLSTLISKNAIFDGKPEEMMEYLKEFAKTIVPELETTPNIVIKEMDEASAKVSNAVAYYMKSAIDNDKNEYITLNPIKLGDSNDVLGTLSHEGYPGHLYAYVYTKQIDLHNVSRIMTSTAHGEGWATYVELKLYEYAMANTTNQELIDVLNYLYYNHISGFLFETRVDAGIHLQGWKVADVKKYMDSLGYDSSQAKEIYNLLIETPTTYAAYGYGKLVFIELHEKAKEILGDIYDEIEFNAMLLSKGWSSLGELYNTYDEYMKAKCHSYQIQYN